MPRKVKAAEFQKLMNEPIRVSLVHMSRENFPTGYVCIAALIPEHGSLISESELRLVRKLQDFRFAGSRRLVDP